MIAEQAATVFNQKGYHATSLADVMRITGLEKGGIYNHFGTKEDLALASFEHMVGEIRAAFRESLRGPDGAIDRLERIIEVFKSIVRGFPAPGGCPVVNTAIEADHIQSPLGAAARDAIDEWRRFMSSVIEKGVRRGELNASTDASEVTLYVVSALEGAIMLGSLYGDPEIVDSVASRLMAYIRTTMAT